MKKLMSMCLAFALLCLGGNAFADKIKVGIVDFQKIMQTTPKVKTIQESLEKSFKSRRDKLVAMEDSIKKDTEKFKKDESVMNDADKKSLQNKVILARQRFELEGQQYQQELTAAHNQAMEKLYGQIKEAISKVATQDKFDFILQKDAVPYSQSQLDVTDKVLKALG
jgi:outer membrane protein